MAAHIKLFSRYKHSYPGSAIIKYLRIGNVLSRLNFKEGSICKAVKV